MLLCLELGRLASKPAGRWPCNLSVVLGLVTSARLRTGRMSERRRCSHFFLFPFFFFLLVFLRPPGITGLMAGFLVGDGFLLPVRGPEAVAVGYNVLQSSVGRRRPRALFAIRTAHCTRLL